MRRSGGAAVSGKCAKGQLINHLSSSRQEVDHLLHRSRAMHVQRDGDEILCDSLANQIALFVRRVLEHLLAEVVAKWI